MELSAAMLHATRSQQAYDILWSCAVSRNIPQYVEDMLHAFGRFLVDDGENIRERALSMMAQILDASYCVVDIWAMACPDARRPRNVVDRDADWAVVTDGDWLTHAEIHAQFHSIFDATIDGARIRDLCVRKPAGVLEGLLQNPPPDDVFVLRAIVESQRQIARFLERRR